MLKKRILTTLWGLPLVIAAVWFDYPIPWFTVLIAVWGAGAAFEFFHISGINKTPFMAAFGITWTVLFIISPHLSNQFVVPVLFAAAVIIPLIAILLLPTHPDFSSWPWTIAGILYIGGLFSYFVSLRGLADGRGWVLLAMFTIFACDISAYFVGHSLGRYRMAPRISPGKTWEGAAAGTGGAIIISVVFSMILRLPMNVAQAVILGLLVSVFGQMGDLAESLLKRNFGVKDAGKLMAGHGGILDRSDSVLFTGVIVYYFAVIISAIH